MPNVPKGAKQPTDRQAKAEAKGQFIDVHYSGAIYRIDRENADNLELAEFMEEEKYILAIRGYLGLDQWKKWKDSCRDDAGRVKSDHFEPFLNAILAAVGGGSEEAPNSEASSTS